LKKLLLVATQKSNVFTVTHYNAALKSMTTSRMRHRSLPRLWFGARITADTDSDWLKQLKRFTAWAFCFCWHKIQNSFKIVSKQFWNSFVTVLYFVSVRNVFRDQKPLNRSQQNSARWVPSAT